LKGKLVGLLVREYRVPETYSQKKLCGRRAADERKKARAGMVSCAGVVMAT
jgi:hypothetical protein